MFRIDNNQSRYKIILYALKKQALHDFIFLSLFQIGQWNVFNLPI